MLAWVEKAVPVLGILAGAAFAACAGSGSGPAEPADASVDVAVDAGKESETLSDSDTAPAPPPDFHVPGTQMGDVASLPMTGACALCHEGASTHGPTDTWKSSLMAWAGRDPLFFAQLATATQDVPDVGYYCLRCHVPVSVVTTHAAAGKEKALSAEDRDGVTCAFCHAMVDPRFVSGKSPAVDEGILKGLASVPTTFGNAQFVLDPKATRRGPYEMSNPYHPTIQSSFMRTGEMCGTCHDVGNPAVSKLADGTFAYNEMGKQAPSSDPRAQFPLERTYTEWRLSAFAAGGVSMGGTFGGEGGDVVSTCQDCHMPVSKAKGCLYADPRPDLPRHEFAGE